MLAEDLVATTPVVRPFPAQASSAPDVDGNDITVDVEVAPADETSPVRTRSKGLRVTTVDSESARSTAIWTPSVDDASEIMLAVNPFQEGPAAPA